MKPNQQIQINHILFNMIYCPKGEFWMGNHHLDHIHQPRQHIKLNKGFYISETPITQELWQTIMGWNPSTFKSIQKPVEGLTWYDCLAFCNRLSEYTGLELSYQLYPIEYYGKNIIQANVEWIQQANGYRLPTEAEWEYSVKAGTDLIYAGSNQIDDVAWYYANSGNQPLRDKQWKKYNIDVQTEIIIQNQNQTHDVKLKKPNAWGIYDMSGNVSEWCQDTWDEHSDQQRTSFEDPVYLKAEPCLHVFRGGNFQQEAIDCEVACRKINTASFNCDFRGLRIVKNE